MKGGGIVYWFDPFEEFERMQKRMRQLMRSALPKEEFFGSFPVDIIDKAEEVVVRADLPGFDKDEVSVKVTENSIDISAQHKEEKRERGEEEGIKYFRAERSFGALRRVLTLPAEVDADTATAKFDKGVLEIRLKKKKPEKKAKEVKIE